MNSQFIGCRGGIKPKNLESSQQASFLCLWHIPGHLSTPRTLHTHSNRQLQIKSYTQTHFCFLLSECCVYNTMLCLQQNVAFTIFLLMWNRTETGYCWHKHNQIPFDSTRNSRPFLCAVTLIKCWKLEPLLCEYPATLLGSIRAMRCTDFPKL